MIIAAPPLPETAHYPMPQLGAALLKGWATARGHRIEIVDLAIRVRTKNRYPLAKRYDLRVFYEDDDRVRRFLDGGDDAALTRETERLIELGRLGDHELVGFTVTDVLALRPCLCMARVLHERGGHRVVLGGAVFARAELRYLLEFDFVDYLVIGDGEGPLVHLLEHDDPPPACPGLYFRRDGRTVGSGEGFVPLEDKACPEFEPIDVEHHRSMSPLRRPFLPYLLTRGCRYKCAFCSDYANVRFQYTPTEKVTSELRLLADRYDVDAIYFAESNIMNDVERVRDVCEGIRACGLDVEWGGLATIWGIDESAAELMAQAGCRFLLIGVESGSEATNDEMNILKCRELDTIESIMKVVRRAGIHIHTFYIVGFPYETEQSYRESVDFLQKVAPYTTTAHVSGFEVMERTPISMRPDTFELRIRERADDRFRFLQPSAHAFDEVRGRAWEDNDAERRSRVRSFRRRIFESVYLPRYTRLLVSRPHYLVKKALAYPYDTYDLYL